MKCWIEQQSLALLVAAILLVCASEIYAQQVGLNARAVSVATLQAALESLDDVGVLGSVITYSVPGRQPVVASRGYLDINKSTVMGADRLFQIGSQTKMFTVAALLKLQAQGKLNLNDLVSDYVDDTPRPNHLTIRQLAMHTGGIGDSVTFFDPPDGRRPDFDVSFENHLFLGKVAGEKFIPGESWAYNNLGFIILGRLIEVVSGKPLNEYTRTHILAPLGMDETFFGSLETYPEQNMARGYFFQNKQLVDTTTPKLSWASSAGDMVSSIADMRKWAAALLDENNVINISLKDFTRILSTVDESGSFTRYGLGMMERRLAERKLWGHGGFIHGYVTLTLIHPESGIMLHLMMNLKEESEKVLSAAERVCAIALELAEAEL